jgi:hypothetical protein
VWRKDVVNRMAQLHLSDYDLEYAELRGLVWKATTQEMIVNIAAPKHGWQSKNVHQNIVTRLKGTKQPNIQSILSNFSIAFTGVENVQGELLTEGYKLGNFPPEQWPDVLTASAHYEIDEVSSSADGDERYWFHMISEGYDLSFIYVDATMIELDALN